MVVIHNCKFNFSKIIKGTPNVLDVPCAHMGVDLGRLAALVTQQFLNAPKIRTCLQKVSGVTVPQPVQRNRFVNSRSLEGLLQNAFQTLGTVLIAGLTLEQVFIWAVSTEIIAQ